MPLVAWRAGYSDDAIWRSVKGGEYDLPQKFDRADIVIDIGAHIGSFSDTVLERGAGFSYAYEPDVELCALARRNLAAYGPRAVVTHRPVWGSTRMVRFVKAENPNNTGVGRVWHQGGQPMQAISFDDVIAIVSQQGNRPIRLVKMDCEGGEWSIFFESRKLHVPREIIGEWHESRVSADAARLSPNPITRKDLVRILSAAGFDVSVRENLPYTHVGMFYARKR